jgi:hypothetical protein
MAVSKVITNFFFAANGRGNRLVFLYPHPTPLTISLLIN